VDSESRPAVVLEFEYPIAERLAIAEQACFQPPDADADTGLCLPVAQAQQPFREGLDA
jgi:hypothetical protein